MSITVKIKRLHADAKLPSYAHSGDAGMDIFAQEKTIIKRGQIAKIGTGVSMELPEGYVALVWDKSGLASNYGLKNLGGVIDAGYRGEYFITLVNLGNEDYTIDKHHKIAQILIQKVEHPMLEEVEVLSDTSRGQGGFGSTGK